jgi:hypothetical protein
MTDQRTWGETLFAQGDLAEAEACFRECVQRDDRDPHALNDLGVVCHARGDLEQAETWFIKALGADADCPAALANLGDLYYESRRWPLAARQLERYVALQPTSTAALNKLGVVYMEMGEFDKAPSVLRRSLQAEPNQPAVRQTLEKLTGRAPAATAAPPEAPVEESPAAEARPAAAAPAPSTEAAAPAAPPAAAPAAPPAQAPPAEPAEAFELDFGAVDAAGEASPAPQAPPAPEAATATDEEPESRPLRLLFLEQKGLATGGFLGHLVRHFASSCEVRHVLADSLAGVDEALNWADCVWLEWAGQLTGVVTQRFPQVRRKPVICRVHGFEVFTDFPAQIDWSVVDHVVFAAGHKMEIFRERFAGAEVDCSVIYDGVETERFTVAPGKTNTKRVVVLGNINYRKGFPLLLQFHHELLKRDGDFHVFVRGEHRDPRYKMAVETMIDELDLADSVTFVTEWIDDLNAWLADKSHVVSFSLEESFHYAIGNGMAAGLKPAIHAWRESRRIWPERFVFRNLEEFLDIMLGDYDPPAYRQALLDLPRTAEAQNRQIAELISRLTGRRLD